MANPDNDPLSLDVEEDDLALEVRTDSTVTWSTDWTVDTLINQLHRGRFDLEPAFQRRDVWNDVKRSRFIESLLLGIPVPQVILAEHRHSRGKFIVLDGKQRLRSLQRFAGLDGPPMKLTGLQVLQDLNGFTYEDMRTHPHLESQAAALENQVLRAVVLRDWSNEALLYLTFLRLNSNVVGLSPQELRRALHPGPFMDFAMQHSSDSAGIRAFLGNKGPDFRMRDSEILIRHISMTLRGKQYRGNLRAFLDETCKVLNSHWQSEEAFIRDSAFGFDKAIQATMDIFGKNAFKKFSEKGYESRKNRAVLEIMGFYFQYEEVRSSALHQRVAVRELFETTCLNDSSFASSLTSTTKSIEAVNTRFDIWRQALEMLMPETMLKAHNG